ncbi:MAG: TadE/TadG family type IV pilus assembly protein [Pseudomonadota bacterium]
MTWWRRLFRRGRAEEGGSTVEFVLVFPVFVAAAFSTFEAGILMTKAVMLDRGLDFAMRDLRLGNVDGGTPDEVRAEIRDTICARGVFFVNCEDTVLVELSSIENVADYPTTSAACIDTSEIDNAGVVIVPQVNFIPGSPDELMFVRVCAAVDTIFPGIGLGLKLPKDGANRFNIVSTSAFVYEPE